MNCSNDSNSNTSNCHDDVLNEVAGYNTMHATKDRIEHCKKREYDSIKMSNIFRAYMKGNIRLHQVPRNKYFNEFSESDKAVCQESKATNDCKCNNNVVRTSNALPFFSEPCHQPFCSCICV